MLWVVASTLIKDEIPSPQHILDEHHLLLIIGILILVVVLVSAGRGVGTLVNGLIKKFFGSHDVTVNLNEDRAPAAGKGEEVRVCKFSPDQCMEHRAEYERSRRNENDIKNLKTEFSEFKTAFFKKLETIEGGVNDIKVTLAGTMASLQARLDRGGK